MATTPISFNANAVIAAAFADLGVYPPDEAIPASDAQRALLRLNTLISSLGLSPLTFPYIVREVFDVVAGQGTYTMGPGGDFDTIRPTALTGSGLLMPAQSVTTGAVEISRGMMTSDAYEANQVKDMQTAMWTDVYFQPTYADGLAAVILWPVPNSTTYQCVTYRGDALQGFANLTTLYDFPSGAFEMLEYQLGKRLDPGYGGRGWTAQLEDLARESLFVFKRNNFKLTDLAVDPAMTHSQRGGYIIQTGTGG